MVLPRTTFEDAYLQYGQSARDRRFALELEFANRGLSPAALPVPIGASDEEYIAAMESVLAARDAQGGEEAIRARQRQAQANLGTALTRPIITPEMVTHLPGPLQPIGSAARELTSPAMIAATLLTAGAGPAVAGGIRGGTGVTGVARGLLAGAIEPVGGSFAARAGTEVALSTAATAAATEAGRLLPEGAPGYVRAPVQLGAGLVGGAGALGAIRGAPRGITRVGAAAERAGIPSPVSVADASTIPPTGAAGAAIPPTAPATVTRVPNREEVQFLRGQVTQRLGSVGSEIADAAKAGDQPRLASLRQQMLRLEAQRNDIRAGKYLLTVDPNDPAERLASAIEHAGISRELTDVARHAERQRRFAQAMAATRGLPSTEKGVAFTSKLGGPLPSQGFAPVADQFTPDDVVGLFDRIWDDTSPLFGFQKRNADQALKAILDPQVGAVPRQFELELLERVFGPRLSAAFLRKRTGWAKWGPEILDAMNVSKTIRSAYDASAPLRQGVFLAPSHLRESVGNLKNMVRAMASEGASDDIYEAIVADPYYARLVTQGKLHIIDPVRRGLVQGTTDREEFFLSRIAGKIPGVKGSERGYVTYLNKLRFDVAKRTLQNWERAGINLDEAGAEIGRMTSFLNKATGRGSFGRAENIVPYMSAMFWSPRLAISRFQVPVEVFSQLARGIRGSAADRLLAQQMARELAAFVGTGATILTIIHKSGMGTVELDPRSSDFGKIRVGGITVDFWGGFQQVARYTAQVASGEYKPITKSSQKDYVRTTTIVRPGDEVKAVKRPPFDTLGRYVWSKLSPGLPSIAAAEASRQTFIGEDLTDKQKLPLSFGYGPDVSVRMNQYIEQFIPLFEVQLAEAIAEEGWRTGLATTAPVGLGLSTDVMQEVQTEQVPRPKKEPTQQKGLWR